jgi:hypothetical protein
MDEDPVNVQPAATVLAIVPYVAPRPAAASAAWGARRYTKEQCEEKVRHLRAQIEHLKAEYMANKTIIMNKVRGQIRIAQRRNNQIKDEIRTLRACMDPWFNGGVW